MRGYLRLVLKTALLLPAVAGVQACLCPAQTATAANRPKPASEAFQLNFDAAYTAFNAGKTSDAAALLEQLQHQQPASFQVHELLGLTYAAQNRFAVAIDQLGQAVKLQPRSAQAYNNLATVLARNGDFAAAQAQWQHALVLRPGDADVNMNLARLYLRGNKVAEALPLLQAAHTAEPSAADTTYNLALADLLTGHLAESRLLVGSLLTQHNSSEYHNLLGKVDEAEARYIDAANEFATAAHLDATEDNIFTWASELLLHRAYVAAIDVFEQGTYRYPTSPRLWVGQGMALYSRGQYEPSIKALLTAADLNADDPRCYLFLSKAYLSAPSQAAEVIERFRRYAALQPNNSVAQFYYAISLWKGRRAEAGDVDYSVVERLLLRSLALDDGSAQAHLQLGILYNDQHMYDKAKVQYLRAIQLDPSLPDAHFRLGRAYLHDGDKSHSQVEFDRFQQLQAQHQAEVDKERAEVQQFVIAAQPASQPASPPQ